jgi:hypothetical protein
MSLPNNGNMAEKLALVRLAGSQGKFEKIPFHTKTGYIISEWREESRLRRI